MAGAGSFRLVPLAAALAGGLLLSVRPDGAADAGFDAWSDGATMRVDYHHAGRAAALGAPAEESVALDAVRREGPWPGSRRNLIDLLGLGAYRVEVRDRATSRLLYAQGYASIYGEWETTDEARAERRVFHESVRFPFPRKPVQVDLFKRAADQSWRPLGTFLADPASQETRRDPVSGRGVVWNVFENGPVESKVDLLILGDGYTAAEIPKFHADVKRLVDILFSVPPFKDRKADFNVRAIDLAGEDSGIDRPSTGVYKRTVLGTTYDIFGSERYALTYDNRAFRDIAAQAPYEFVEILINNDTYGGGGIHNLYATCAVGSGSAPYVFVHEFGHHFAALADEYYTSDVAYDTGAAIVEPWEPNVTALLDPAALKWKDLVTPGTALPTPWGKDEYEAHSKEFQAKRKALRAGRAPESEMDKLFASELAWSKPFLAAPPNGGKVGAFEGASYKAKGLYRPSSDCI
ncbi:MAG TPA: M64 family metallopeptidase, partial [Candidatus Polarisedimenticolia bacterium]|nr:M64 family metallopeptidase [Candidatus Polarisedimenticolia bacterium]